MGPDGIPPIILSKCASVLYRPLHYLFCLTVKYGYLPNEWKIHKIIPIFKSGNHALVKDYRPISLLSTTSKVQIFNKTVSHISSMINPAQFGFLKNRSTTQQLILFLSNTFNNRHQLDVIYLDISKAFDSVSHSHLLLKLVTFNIGGEIWSWFKAYTTNRNQFVSINTIAILISSGVLQGNILGPLLFVLYMNDLPNAVKFSCSADDTTTYAPQVTLIFYRTMFTTSQTGAWHPISLFTPPKAITYILIKNSKPLTQLMDPPYLPSMNTKTLEY